MFEDNKIRFVVMGWNRNMSPWIESRWSERSDAEADMRAMTNLYGKTNRYYIEELK